MPVDRFPLDAIVRVAGVGTAVSVVLGTWLAWIISNRRFPFQREVGAMATLALVLPAPIVGYYLLCTLHDVWRLQEWGLGVVSCFSGAPLVIRTARSAFASLDPQYAIAARSLGANDLRVFLRIEFPLAFRLLAAGGLLATTRIVAELAFAFWLVDPRP